MKFVSLSELRANPGKYVGMAQTQDIYITKNGKVAARLTGVHIDKAESARALFGLLPNEVDLDAAREEKLR